MIRLITLVAAVLFANASFAGDLLPIVFEESSIISSGKMLKCDLYYILLGDNGSLNKGDLIQLTSLESDPDRYEVGKGRFTLSDDILTIYWDAPKGEKIGHVETVRLTVVDAKSSRLEYVTIDHDDSSQVGQKLRARAVNFESLPKWVKNAVTPSLIAKLPAEDRVLIHKMQAEQLRATSEIIDAYLRAIR